MPSTTVDNDPQFSTTDGIDQYAGSPLAMTVRVMLVYNTMKYLHRMREDLIVDLHSRGAQVIAVAPFDGAENKLRSIGVTCIDWPLLGHSVNPFREFKAFIKLSRIIRDNHPTHVFSFTIKPVIYSGLIARRLAGVQAYSMITGLGVLFAGNSALQRWVQRIAGVLYKMALVKNNIVFVQNDVHARYIRESGFVRPDRIVCIPGSGVDLTHFTPHEARSPVVPRSSDEGSPASRSDGQSVDAPGGIAFLMACRLLRHKGVEEYIQACAKVAGVRSENPGGCPRFYLAGPFVTGPSAIGAKELADWLRLSPVEYLGEIDDMRALLQTVQALVLPSYYPEGTPRVILEALACGLAVVTTDNPGCRDTVITGRNDAVGSAIVKGDNGFLARINVANDASQRQGSPDGLGETLVECMTHMVDHPHEVAQMGAASRRLAQMRYDVRAVNATIIDAMGLNAKPVTGQDSRG